jgi:hypothetical protein
VDIEDDLDVYVVVRQRNSGVSGVIMVPQLTTFSLGGPPRNRNRNRISSVDPVSTDLPKKAIIWILRVKKFGESGMKRIWKWNCESSCACYVYEDGGVNIEGRSLRHRE